MNKFVMKTTILFSCLLVALCGCETANPTFSPHPLSQGQIHTVTYDATKRASYFLYLPDIAADESFRKAIKSDIDRITELQEELKLIQTPCPKHFFEKKRKLELRISETARKINEFGTHVMRPVVLAENPPDAGSSTTKTLDAALKFADKVPSGNFSNSNVFQTIKLAQLNSQNYVLRDALYRLNESLVLKPELLDKEKYCLIFSNIMATVRAINAQTNEPDTNPKNANAPIQSGIETNNPSITH